VFRQDFIKRQIEMLAQALARIAQKRNSGELSEALSELQHAYGSIGFDPMLLRLDARSLVMLVKDREKLSALCALLDEEAELRRAMGNQADALGLAERSAEIKRTAKLTGNE
jgi:hypothetical protein